MEVSTSLRWAPTGSVVATARPIDTAIWERNRSEITDLYFVQNKTLNEVMEYMSSTHNFNPSKRQYVQRFNKWRLFKNASSASARTKNKTTHTTEEALLAEDLDGMASYGAEAASLPDQSSSGVSTTLSNTRIHLNSPLSDGNDAISKSGTNLTTNTTSNEDHEQYPRLEGLFRTPPGLCSLEATNHQETRQQDWDGFASITDFEDPASQERSNAARKDSEPQPSLDKQTLERLSDVPHYACPDPSCHKYFRRKGDLTRHHFTTHQRPASFLCHFRHCPRSINGRGFARKDKLVDHLTSKMHGLNKDNARYEATKNNAHWT